jgi:hypothetical protein
MPRAARGFIAEGSAQGYDLRATLSELALERRANFEATRRPIRDYADMIPEPGFGDLDFTRFPFLLEPFYSDEVAAANEVVYVKSTQVGASTGSWRWAAREADQYGRTVIYTFPTQDHVNDFGDQRIEPAIEGSEYLRSRIPAHFVHTKKLKRIGRGWLYLRGAKSQAGAQSVAAQSIVFDEYDELETRIVEQFERRLSGAKQQGKAPRMRRLGVPRMPGGPMDRAWRASDRREWLVTCPACGVEQPIVWSKNVRWTMPGDVGLDADGQRVVFRAGHDAQHLDQELEKVVGDVWRACRECEASLEGAPILTGRWVAQNPGHPVIGFYIHRLIVADADLHAMVVNSRKRAASAVEAFHQNDLGEAFSPSEASLTEADVLRACSFGEEPQSMPDGVSEYTAGIDVASVRNLNYRIDRQNADGTRSAVAIGEAASFREMATILNRFGVMVAVIDHMPERRLARALASELAGRVHLAVYVEPGFDPKSQPKALDFDPVENLVKVNRTEAIDAMMDSIRSARSKPLRTPPPGYVDQLTAPKRLVELDAKERPRRVYRTPSGLADDYAHADVYALLATEMWRLRKRVEWQQQMANQPVPDSALGVSRGTLDVRSDEELGDDYYPGFGLGGR